MFEAGAEKIDTVAEHGPISRSVLYEAVANRELIVRKHGRITLVLREDWENFLRSRPVMEPKRSPPPVAGSLAPKARRGRAGAVTS